MLKGLRQWIFGTAMPPGWLAVRQWCDQAGGSFKATRGREGFVLHFSAHAVPVRVEWGPSQRRYLGGHELRLRGETGLDPETYALLMPRQLFDSLERELYSQFTDGVQTQFDEQTPEELRWMAMSPKLGGRTLGELRGDFAVIGNLNTWTTLWLQGPLAEALAAHAASHATAGMTAFALIAQRGRLVLRCAMETPDPAAVAACLDLFKVALVQARQGVPGR